ncbi:hypothetical protein LCGC14_1497070, partial [marine sediment metagenome]
MQVIATGSNWNSLAGITCFQPFFGWFGWRLP